MKVDKYDNRLFKTMTKPYWWKVRKGMFNEGCDKLKQWFYNAKNNLL